MLAHLDIRNIVLIDHVALDFGAGLSVLTGETGAGKSILLDAVGLLRGDRADAGLLRKGADQASVSALFVLPPGHPACAVLADQGLALEGDDLVLRRVLMADGKSRAFINDQACSVGLLKTIGTMLIDLHGQFDTSDLFDASEHRNFVDRFGDLILTRAKVAAAWNELKDARDRYETAQAAAAQAREEEDNLRESVRDLDALAPQPGEESALLERRTLLSSRAQIIEGLSQLRDVLQGDGGSESQLAQASRGLDRLRARMGDRVDPWLATLDLALSGVRDVAQEIERTLFDLADGENDLDAIEDRLHALRTAARRYGGAADDLPAKRDDFHARLSLIDGGADQVTKFAQDVQAAQATYHRLAADLSAKRQDAAKRFDRAVMAELPPLKLEKARFETRIDPLPEARQGPDGIDDVRFMGAMNPGTPFAPLDKVASGGELSRLMLALKVVMSARQNAQLVMIFDEVDSGIGGAVAAAVAQRLARLAQARQVLAVTHAPQVAACADHHLVISKTSKGQTTSTHVTRLEGEDPRREEIARMLSGEEITNEARAAAQKLRELRGAA